MYPNWREANDNEPCPVCGHKGWCMLSNDGELCICHRTMNDRPTKQGDGWIFRLRDSPLPASRRAQPPPPPPPQGPTPAEHFATLPHGDDVQVRLCRELMRELSIPVAFFEMHDVRWDRSARAAAFPMRDAGGRVTGIRYRELKTGRKWSYRGSKDGLFYIPELIPVCDEIVVCEGPTDMLAACACGIWAVGRSSCVTGSAALGHLKGYLRSHEVRRVTIAADNDEPKTRPDGTQWRPGWDGAAKLARDLGCACRVALPFARFKDLRDWYAHGGMTEEKFRVAAAAAKWLGGEDAGEALP